MSEIKWVGNEYGPVSLGSATTMQTRDDYVLFVTPNVGSGKNERVGNIIRGKRLTFNLFIKCNDLSAPTQANQVVRVLVYKFRGGNYTYPPAWSDVWSTATGMTALPNSANIQVLKSWTFPLGNNQKSSVPMSKFIKFSMPYPASFIWKTNVSSTVTNQEDLPYIQIVNAANDAVSGIVYSLSFRLSYIDV